MKGFPFRKNLNFKKYNKFNWLIKYRIFNNRFSYYSRYKISNNFNKNNILGANIRVAYLAINSVKA